PASVDIGAFESGEWSLTVTTLLDSGGSGLTLRQAIDEVNTIDPLGGVTITFAPGLTGTLDLTQGMLPPIAGNLAIAGPGAGLLDIDAQGQSGILSIDSGVSAKLSGLTLAHGNVVQSRDTFGGAILNRGILSLSGCTLSGNTAVYGGALSSFGTATLNDCT